MPSSPGVAKALDNHRTFNTGVNEGPAADVKSNVKLQSHSVSALLRESSDFTVRVDLLDKKVPLLGSFVSSL